MVSGWVGRTTLRTPAPTPQHHGASPSFRLLFPHAYCVGERDGGPGPGHAVTWDGKQIAAHGPPFCSLCPAPWEAGSVGGCPQCPALLISSPAPTHPARASSSAFLFCPFLFFSLLGPLSQPLLGLPTHSHSIMEFPYPYFGVKSYFHMYNFILRHEKKKKK